jgi:hypothetical protein
VPRWLRPGWTIQGLVLKHASGRPLARAVVRLDPVPKPSGDKGYPLTVPVGLSESFVFPTAAPGVYLLTAAPDRYFPGTGRCARVPAGQYVESVMAL